MDAKLRRELDAIARDNRSGAAELALRCVQATDAWLKRRADVDDGDLLYVAKTIKFFTQTSMAPVQNFANELAFCAHNPTGARTLCARLRDHLRKAPLRIARRFVRSIARRKPYVVTYSYSSTVLTALIMARRKIEGVVCSEGRPTLEGRHTAARLAKAGIQVTIVPDMALSGFVERRSGPCIVVTGADELKATGFLNRSGTELLVQAASRERIPFYVLADSLKIFPTETYSVTGGPRSDHALWANRPRGVRVYCPVLDLAEYGPVVRILTEKGWMTPARVRRELKKIRISPRLKTLVD